MIDTRQRLLQLLDRNNISVPRLSEISKVPEPTIYRFLNGKIGTPRPETLCKLAEVLGVTEGQIRGLESIEGLNDIREVFARPTLESVLTPEELIAIEGMRAHDKKIRTAWLTIGRELCKKSKTTPPKKGDQRVVADRRSGGMRSLAHGSNITKYIIKAEKEGILGEPQKA